MANNNNGGQKTIQLNPNAKTFTPKVTTIYTLGSPGGSNTARNRRRRRNRNRNRNGGWNGGNRVFTNSNYGGGNGNNGNNNGGGGGLIKKVEEQIHQLTQVVGAIVAPEEKKDNTYHLFREKDEDAPVFVTVLKARSDLRPRMSVKSMNELWKDFGRVFRGGGGELTTDGHKLVVRLELIPTRAVFNVLPHEDNDFSYDLSDLSTALQSSSAQQSDVRRKQTAPRRDIKEAFVNIVSSAEGAAASKS
ncbi:hypothetical protein [Veiled chameleon serpentovirus B]|uniref:Uncharacterized protein n=1 Tax=Veiled chameleon serpentovirus B TaxID=2806430 RepID=A0AAE7P9R5_9NIDO|nr:hypothetical protein QKS91_gp8 [Veiled chameleon serpentovirus B]QRC47045.1 hypothetical protein [Veiled chameleon serpentovirus B]